MKQSRYFYARITGNRALFTNPATKGGGEKYSYDVPTRQALKGIIDSVYRKPTFINVIDEVKVIKKIQRESQGTRNLIGFNYGSDLSITTYLADVEYLIKFHFEWNLNRPDLKEDRNLKKHEEMMKRALELGGRKDVFLGTRECFATIDKISEGRYILTPSYYKNETIKLGIMFQSFDYPTSKNEKLKAYYTATEMVNGIIRFKPNKECDIVNTLDNYLFYPTPKDIKPIEQEYDEYIQKG